MNAEIAPVVLELQGMGVVVWNVSDDAPASFTVTPEKGWKLTATDVPEGEPKEGPLGAQSIRLLVFERDL